MMEFLMHWMAATPGYAAPLLLACLGLIIKATSKNLIEILDAENETPRLGLRDAPEGTDG